MQAFQAGTYSLLLAPIAAATAVRTANLDCAGVDSATIIISLGAELNTNSTNVAVRLLESNDTTASNFATYNAVFNQTLDNTAALVEAYHVDMRGRKRYQRIELTPDATTNGPVITAVSAIVEPENKGALDANQAAG